MRTQIFAVFQETHLARDHQRQKQTAAERRARRTLIQKPVPRNLSVEWGECGSQRGNRGNCTGVRRPGRHDKPFLPEPRTREHTGLTAHTISAWALALLRSLVPIPPGSLGERGQGHDSEDPGSSRQPGAGVSGLLIRPLQPGSESLELPPPGRPHKPGAVCYFCLRSCPSPTPGGEQHSVCTR